MARLIPPDKLEQIRSASDIVDVIGSTLPLKRAGANFVALCPFHREKSPSFNVNPHRQIFRCFGCGKGGDVFKWIQEYEGLSFVEAIKRLADRANIPLEFDNTPGAAQSRHLKDTLLQMHEGICQRWQNALASEASGQVARDYLAKRGVSEEGVKLFRLGAAPDAWDDTVNWAKSKGYDLPIVEQAGLIIRKEETDRYYDRFRGRLMFPICDEQGRVIGFSGRILSGDEKTAKYVNSPETPIFSKGKVFFGLDKSKRAILDSGFAIICEGQLDLIACYMAGVKNIVAPQGTAFTGDHARILKRYVNEVVLCFDSDNAGQKAAARAQDSLLASGLAIRVATIPSPHDPDTFIKEYGGQAFQDMIENAEEFFEFYLQHLCRINDVKTERGQSDVVRAMSEMVGKTGNQVLIDTYAQKTAIKLANERDFRISPDAVRADFRKAPQKHSSLRQSEEENFEEPSGTSHPPPDREFWLLRFLLQHDEQMEWVAHHLDLNWLQHPAVRRILAARVLMHTDQTWRGVPSLLDTFEDDEARNLIMEAAAEEHPTAELGRNIVETIRLLRNDCYDRQIAEFKIKLAQSDLPEAEQHRILQQQSELRRAKQQPLMAMGEA